MLTGLTERKSQFWVKRPLPDKAANVTGSPTLSDAARGLLKKRAVYAIAASRSGAGTSYVARELALEFAKSGYVTLLVDMDISKQSHYPYFSGPEASEVFGALSGPYDGAYDAEPFWRVTPSQVANADDDGGAQSAHMAVYQCPQSGFAVTNFLWDTLAQGQSVNIAHASEYWNRLRDAYDMIVVDVPALDRSDVGRCVFGDANGVILVTPEVNAFDNQVTISAASEVGGRCIGAIMNTPPVSQLSRTAPPSLGERL